MKKTLTIIALTLAATACGGHSHTSEAESHEAHEADATENSHDTHSDEDLIELPAEQAERFGVEVDTVRPGTFSTVIRASAIIERSADNSAIAAAPAAGIVRIQRGVTAGSHINRGARIASIDPAAVAGGDNNRAAKAALDAARREVERLTPLYKERLVTSATYNAAVAAYEEAKAAYSPAATGGRVTAPIAGTVTQLFASEGSYVQAGDPVAAISANNKLTLHAEVAPELYEQLADIVDARIGGDFTLSEHGGRKSGVSSENGYACIYFTFNGNGPAIPGSGTEVYLLGRPRAGVISVPTGAISEQQGEYFVYEAHSPGHYVKLPVKLGDSDGRRIEITSGLRGGEVIVMQGAATVRLAENSGAVPEGHSHNH